MGRRRAGRLASGAAIRAAAATLFLERGYDGTSMDDVAAAAQVSKQTIYTHFSDKESLFAGLVMENADRVEGFLETMGDAVRDATDVEDGLERLAATYLRFVIRPEVVRLRRLVLSQAARFPEVARAYYERVPQRMYETLAVVFEELAAGGSLRIDDAALAARQFAWLVLGDPLDRGMFIEPPEVLTDAERERAAHAAVRMFLAAYGGG